MEIMQDARMSHIDDMEQTIIDRLGEAGALDAITRALSYDQKAEIYDYIIRVYDLEGEAD